ncbi:MAG: hypothetical protein ISR77_17400 [Pirellulaceae bacterium]|nr:hypothetical protein [Pirellulaceae bacterium]
MRSSILPAGLMLFLLLCLAGCGGDSPETASTEGGGDGAMDPGGPDGDMGMDPGMEGGMEDPGMEEGMDDTGMGDPGMEDPGMAEDYMEEGMDDTGMGDPGMEDPGMAEDYMEEGMDDTGMGDPGMEDPGMAEDYMEEGMDDTGMGDPGMEDPGMAEDYMEEGMGDPGMGDPGMGGGRTQGSQPKTFAEMAQQAFGQGRDNDAFKYLFAHAVTADDASARGLLAKMGWIGPLKRPGLALRWGIGIEFNSKGYDGDKLYPIGSTQKVQARERGGFGQGRGRDNAGDDMMQGGGDMMQGGGDMMQGGGGQGADGQLEKYTGELGQMAVDGLRERVARGDFGLVLKEAGSAGTSNRGRGGMDPGMEGGMDPGMEGGMDPGMEGGMEEGMGGRGGGRSGRSRGRGAMGPAQQLVPGVVLVGLAPAKDLLKMAEQAGVDVLCVFNVSVSQIRRTGQVSNNVKIQLYNLADGKKTFETDVVNNLAVQNARANENSRGGDPVDKELEKLFQEIDTNWRLGAIPTSLQPEHALGRVGELLKETHQNPLSVLAEIRMYQTRGLLQDSHLLLAYQRMTNDHSGTALATGTEEERKQVIEPWLPVRGG